MLRDKIDELLSARAKTAPERKFMETDDLVYDLGLDSLSMVELIIDLENEFNIEIDGDDISHLYKYGEIVNYITKVVNTNEEKFQC